MPRALLNSIAIIAIAAVALGPAGCRWTTSPAASPSHETSASANSTSTAGSSVTSTQSIKPSEPLNKSEAQDLEAELNAIEKELDSMDLPSDSDFKDIEGELK